MTTKSEKEISDNIHKGITEGVRKAVREHKNAGRSIAVWRNGRVEKIPAEEIKIEG
jgi:hypothetical protein